MRPVMLATKLLEVLTQKRAHLDDSIRHTLDLTEPLLVQLGISHDGGCDTGAVDGWVRVEGTDEDLDLRFYALLFLG